MVLGIGLGHLLELVLVLGIDLRRLAVLVLVIVLQKLVLLVSDIYIYHVKSKNDLCFLRLFSLIRKMELAPKQKAILLLDYDN